MPTGQAPPTNQETTPQKPPKKSLLTRLKASFAAKVSKSAYDSLLAKHEQVKREKDTIQNDYNELLKEATEVKAEKESLNELYKASLKTNNSLLEECNNLKSTIADIEKFLTEVEDVIDE